MKKVIISLFIFLIVCIGMFLGLVLAAFVYRDQVAAILPAELQSIFKTLVGIDGQSDMNNDSESRGGDNSAGNQTQTNQEFSGVGYSLPFDDNVWVVNNFVDQNRAEFLLNTAGGGEGDNEQTESVNIGGFVNDLGLDNLEKQVDNAIAQLSSSAGISEFKLEERVNARLGGADAIRITFTSLTRDTNLKQTQYYLLTENAAVFVTITASADNYSLFITQADKLLSNLRVL